MATGFSRTEGTSAPLSGSLTVSGAEPCSPCGRCRQQLAEFAGPATPVHLCGPEGVRQTVTLAELLPLAFGPEALGR